MKKLFFISVFYFFCYGFNAQTFTVGSTCCNYNLVNKTFAVVCNAFATNISVKESFPIDIDGDLVPDITVNSYCYMGSGATASKPRTEAIYLTSSNGVESVFTPSNGCCPGDSVIKNLIPGTPFSAGWDWRPLTPTISLTGPSYKRHEVIYYYYSIPVSFTYLSGQWINSFYAGFRKILPSNDTIYGWIQMNSNFPGKVIDFAYTCGTYTAAPPTSTITTAPSAICKGDSIAVTANPPGGIFSGPGVVGNKFKSAALSPGTYTVFYTLPNPNGCSTQSSTLSLTINQPVVSIVSSNSICMGNQITLNANPSGGIFSGSGVSGNNFNSNSSGPGIKQITYSYTNSLGCTNTASMNMTVIDPTVSIKSNNTTICLYDNVYLTCYGANTYTWSNGINADWNVVYPTPTTATYSVIGDSLGCLDSAFITINVLTQQLVLTATSDHSLACPGDTVILTISGNNSNLTVWDDLWNYYSNTLNSATVAVVTGTASTTFYIQADSVYTNGCPKGGIFLQNVSACVGIKELLEENDLFKIFPNPNSGEFEIKGTKEETIFITNELGQLINTKILNVQNNYSIKINDLQNGIYFVGNKFSRQKIVVIK